MVFEQDGCLSGLRAGWSSSKMDAFCSRCVRFKIFLLFSVFSVSRLCIFRVYHLFFVSILNMGDTQEVIDVLIMKKLEPIETAMNFINEQYEAILAKLNKIEEENASLKLENNALKSKLEMAVIKINEHEMSLDEQEQYQRRDCVEIKGIPTTEDENTSDLVVQVADLLDVELEESDISISHRLPATDKTWSDSRGMKHPPPPPIIIAKFVRREDKENFYKARNRLKNKTVGDLQRFNDLDLDCENQIYISESLNQRRKKLFKSCLKVKKDLNFRFISTSNGRIFLKKDQAQSLRRNQERTRPC